MSIVHTSNSSGLSLEKNVYESKQRVINNHEEFSEKLIQMIENIPATYVFDQMGKSFLLSYVKELKEAETKKKINKVARKIFYAMSNKLMRLALVKSLNAEDRNFIFKFKSNVSNIKLDKIPKEIVSSLRPFYENMLKLNKKVYEFYEWEMLLRPPFDSTNTDKPEKGRSFT